MKSSNAKVAEQQAICSFWKMIFRSSDSQHFFFRLKFNVSMQVNSLVNSMRSNDSSPCRERKWTSCQSVRHKQGRHIRKNEKWTEFGDAIFRRSNRVSLKKNLTKLFAACQIVQKKMAKTKMHTTVAATMPCNWLYAVVCFDFSIFFAWFRLICDCEWIRSRITRYCEINWMRWDSISRCQLVRWQSYRPCWTIWCWRRKISKMPKHKLINWTR